jgi:ATP-dependent RNA helicase DeaD
MTFPTTHPALGRALAAREYTVPTSVQLAVLAENANARDMLVSAQTGSGKTVAFGLAMAATLLGDAERFEVAGEPQALIIAPTRELALQVQRELAWLYAETNARVVTCVGGMDPRAEARLLIQGAHIVVGTPGRLRDHIERGRLVLTDLKVAVLDEADEMLDLGFREDLEFILDKTAESRRTLMFSATVPREIETLAQRFQRDCLRIETAGRNEQHADIEYQAMRVVPGDVENAVVNILRFHEARATLVFCATRENVKRMQFRLQERGFSAVALSGELTQGERLHALQALRDGRARVLVATDVAARGLDLPDLALVIHADLPRDHETLLHRSGRTGRAGKKGLCVLVVPFTLNRKANQLIGAARVKVTWGRPPSPEEIRIRDQERFLADPVFSETAVDEDQVLARALQAGRTADEIALALVRIHRARLPAPEDIIEDTGPKRAEDRGRTGKKNYERKTDYVPAGDGTSGARERGPRPPKPFGQHPGGRDMVWFRLNIGRDRDADPRWLLPLICKAGDVTKADIGSIRVQDRDTRFQIVASLADKFDEAVKLNKPREGNISRVIVPTSADDQAVTEAIKAIAHIGGAATRDESPVSDRAPEATPLQQRTDAPADGRRKTPWKDRAKSDGAKSDGAKSGERKPYEHGKPKGAWSKSGEPKFDGAKPAWSKSGADKSAGDKTGSYKGKKDWAGKKDWPAKTESTGKKDWDANKEWAPKKEWAAKTGDATKKDWAGKQDSAGKKDWAAKKEWPAKKDWADKKDVSATGDAPARKDAPAIDPAAAEARKFDPNQRGVGKRTAPHGGKPGGRPGGHSGGKSASARHSPSGDRKHGASKPNAPRGAGGGDARTPSKYAHKKKSRPAPSA